MDQKLLSEELSRLGEIQEKYDLMNAAIRNIVQAVGEEKPKVSTEDEVSDRAKNLINKRTELRNKDKRSRADILELTELNRTIRRKVRQDIKNYDFEIVQETIEESWPTKKVKKFIKKGQYLLSSIKSVAQNILIYNRQEIVKEASKFYLELHSDDRPNKSSKK